MFKRLAAGLLGLVVTGCATRQEVIEQTAILVPDKEVPLEEHVQRALACPGTSDVLHAQYEESKRTGCEWGGVILDTAMGTRYVPITNEFLGDINLLFRWYKTFDFSAKTTLAGHVQMGEDHFRRELSLPRHFPSPVFDELRAKLAVLPHRQEWEALGTVDAYRNLVQKSFYRPEAAALERALKEGTLVAYVHAHPAWMDREQQGSETDHCISESNDLVLFVPHDGHLVVRTISRRMEKEVARVYLPGEPAVAPYVGK
ncbi:hypothetical protein HY492_02490 [Candidatus Woesearchaeota archaeon]|nr:hypothetical protein [Candidatus Woesearchaeota archaeon]